MYKLKKYRELDKKTKTMHILSYSLEIVMTLATIGLLIFYLVNMDDPSKGDYYKGRLPATVGTILLFLSPMIIEHLFKTRFSLGAHIFFVLSMTYASFLGCCLNFHGSISWYDEVSHFIFGYISCLVVFYIAVGWKDYKNQNKFMMAAVIFFVGLGFAIIWEAYEFLSDGLFGGSAQGYIRPELLEEASKLGYTGIKANFYAIKHGNLLWDTITDLMLHLCGSILFSVQYLLHKTIKIPLMLSLIEKDYLSSRQNYYKKIDTDVTVSDEFDVITTDKI